MHKGLIKETATLRTIIRSPIILTTDPEMVERSAEIGLELLLGVQSLNSIIHGAKSIVIYQRPWGGTH
jgi:hypothetical protein